MKKALVALCALLGACASKKTVSAPDVAAPVLATGLNSEVQVLQATFSEDPDRVYLLMVGAKGSTGAQIFERHLKTGVERRVTWQDGMIESFDVSRDGDLVYSSSTDEIKDRLHPSERPAEQGLPLDLYRSDRFGDDIQRLTDHPGYDGEPAFTPLGREILYVSKRGNEELILRMGLESLKPVVIASGGELHRHSPAFATDGQIAWHESVAVNGAGFVRIAGRKAPLFAEERRVLRLKRAPAPKGWLVAERTDVMSSRIAYVTANPFCEKELWSGPGLLRSMDFSPRAGKMLLVMQEGNQNVLWVKDLPADAMTCEAAPAPAKLNP